MSFAQLRSVYFDNNARPLVITSAATNLAATTTDGNGTVVSDNTSTITERGFVWNTGGSPTTADGKVTVAGTTGVFTGTMTGLLALTTYYYRAYAINAFGTSYGDVWLFTTASAGGGAVYAPMLAMMGMGT